MYNYVAADGCGFSRALLQLDELDGPCPRWRSAVATMPKPTTFPIPSLSTARTWPRAGDNCSQPNSPSVPRANRRCFEATRLPCSTFSPECRRLGLQRGPWSLVLHGIPTHVRSLPPGIFHAPSPSSLSPGQLTACRIVYHLEIPYNSPCLALTASAGKIHVPFVSDLGRKSSSRHTACNRDAPYPQSNPLNPMFFHCHIECELEPTQEPLHLSAENALAV